MPLCPLCKRGFLSPQMIDGEGPCGANIEYRCSFCGSEFNSEKEVIRDTRQQPSQSPEFCLKGVLSISRF